MGNPSRLRITLANARAADFGRALAEPPEATARRLVQVYDGGAMPSLPDRVYLTHPVTIAAGPTEGSSASIVADSSRSIPVVVIGRAPEVGDVLVAHNQGGVWLAEIGLPSPYVPCGGCQLPKTNLTVSWTNTILGPFSKPLIYDAPSKSWASECHNQMIARLSCVDGLMNFRVSLFTTGGCPTGTSATCQSPGAAPLSLTPDPASTCEPLFLRYIPGSGGCPTLASRGYTSFTVTL